MKHNVCMSIHVRRVCLRRRCMSEGEEEDRSVQINNPLYLTTNQRYDIKFQGPLELSTKYNVCIFVKQRYLNYIKTL